MTMTRESESRENAPNDENDELQGTPGLGPDPEAVADAIEADGLEAVRDDAILSALRRSGRNE
jgi:hypothetical protein